MISEASAKTHVARILQKLGLRDRVQAVMYAYESGLVTPGATHHLRTHNPEVAVAGAEIGRQNFCPTLPGAAASGRIQARGL